MNTMSSRRLMAWLNLVIAHIYGAHIASAWFCGFMALASAIMGFILWCESKDK